AVVLDAIRAAQTPPPKASRALAIVHVAMFDALNGFHHTFESYHVTQSPPQNASGEAAASAAAHRVLSRLFPAQAATFDEALASSLSRVASAERRNRGVEWGESCADDILALRAGDHSEDVLQYIPIDAVGFWIPTPPAFAPALLPNWPLVTPF